MDLRAVPGLPAADLRPPTVAEPGDPFAGLRVAHLIARLPRGVPIRLRDVVERLNADHLDWSFSRAVVASVAVQLQSNWLADFRVERGFELSDGPAGEELTIEDSARVEPWLIRQVERIHAECVERLREFARDEGAIP
jgi:nucleoside-diphosphate-sugar epimerase